MGGLISMYSLNKQDKMIQLLSKLNHREVEEALSFYIDEYPSLLRVSYRYFDDIFGSMLPDIESCFNYFTDNNPEADLLEIFAVLIIACKGTANWKVKMLFCLFDFDNSQNIDKNELSLVLSAFTKALGKLASGTPPSSSKLFLLAGSIFKEIDKDNSSTLELQEIIDWSEGNQDFQELMAHFSHIQSFELANMRFSRSMDEFIVVEIPEIVDETFIETLVKTVFNRLTVEEVREIVATCSEDMVVDRNSFERVGKCVVAFLISDFTEAKSLDKQELQVALSLLAGEEKPMVIAEDFLRKAGIPRHDRINFKRWLGIVALNHNIGN